ncbi:odorant receptor 49b-like isoform X2 [Cylas formicarius]|uniref:odorant receptor 49b-like isoform X2 n=1 Tax=Cylas formicarius TaxID=197179 RepID=UPI002958BB97|nr:odorant receptor 49b-like isoform X2 [Cylas formicarius]
MEGSELRDRWKMSADRDMFKVAKILMISGGTWKLKMTKSKRLQFFYSLYSVVVQVLYASGPPSLLISLVYLFQTDIAKAIENISRLIVVTLQVLKVLLCQSEGVVRIFSSAVREQVDIYRQRDGVICKIYRDHVNYCKWTTTPVAVLFLLSGMFLSEIGIETTYKFEQLQRRSNETLELPLTVPFWYPFDQNEHHLAALLFQVFQSQFTALYCAVTQAYYNSIFIFVRAQLKILQHNFRNFDDRCEASGQISENFTLTALKKLCLKHQNLIRSVEELNDSLKSIMLLEYSVTSILLAALLFQIMAQIGVAFNIFVFFILSCQLMAMAWNCNEIIIQSTGLASALYESRWYEHSQQVKRIVQVMVLRCQMPLNLTIGPFGPMTANDGLSNGQVSVGKWPSRLAALSL